jgi:hypothetical protein
MSIDTERERVLEGMAVLAEGCSGCRSLTRPTTATLCGCAGR